MGPKKTGKEKEKKEKKLHTPYSKIVLMLCLCICVWKACSLARTCFPQKPALLAPPRVLPNFFFLLPRLPILCFVCVCVCVRVCVRVCVCVREREMWGDRKRKRKSQNRGKQETGRTHKHSTCHGRFDDTRDFRDFDVTPPIRGVICLH
jgi:hypothetical protein